MNSSYLKEIAQLQELLDNFNNLSDHVSVCFVQLGTLEAKPIGHLEYIGDDMVLFLDK